MKNLAQQIGDEFTNQFTGDYLLVESPGRVNLIGEHTDYNEGFVLPAAVDKSIFLAIAANKKNKLRFFATNKNESYETDLIPHLEKAEKHWANYLLGVVDQLQKHGYESEGFDCVFGGNVPVGAGMSSSAALEAGLLFGLDELFNWEIGPVEMAQIAQKAENEFVGVQCGIMDQFSILNGKQDHALKLDCRSLKYELYPFKDSDLHIVLCDTQIRRELASSEYNVRRKQCEEGVHILQQSDNAIQSLRDVSLSFLADHKAEFDPVVYNRCEYVIEENNRVTEACRDLEKNDLQSFGHQMYASHAGLRDKYEVSCKELDLLVDEAQKIDGVLGARMMGGGFGGCTINLVEEEHLESFTNEIQQQYQQNIGKDIEVYQTKISEGTHLVE